MQKKKSVKNRRGKNLCTQAELVPVKLMAIILSMAILFVSLPLSAVAFENGTNITGAGESDNPASNEKPTTVLPSFDIPEVLPLSDLEEYPVTDRMRSEEQSLCDIVFANDDGSRTSFLFGTPVKYVSSDGIVRDKSFYIADLAAEPESGYVGRMEAELAYSVKSSLFSSLEEAFDGKINEEGIQYATLDNDVHTLYGVSSDQGVIVGKNDCFVLMIPSGETGEVSLSTAFSISDGESKERVSYPNVFGEGTLLQYNPTLHGIKEDIILQYPTEQNVFSFLVETSGATLEEENGTVRFLDIQTGESIGKLGEILAFDGKGNISRGSIDVEETEGEYCYRIIITIDPEFLQNATYPVYIDPTVNLYPSGTDYIYGSYTFIEDVSIYDDIDVQGYTFIEWHQIGEVMSTGYYGQAAFRFPALYDTTQPNGYSSLTPDQIGSFKLHVKSTSGTTSTNVLRASTYVPTWPNTFKIFSSAYFNYFNITSNDVTINNVPVNNTFEIDLTGMARHWKNIQYGLENGNYGTPESGVLLWNNGNSGNIWLESVEYSSNIYAVLNYDLGYSSAYLNNKETGEFLGYFLGDLEHLSGHIITIRDEIDWQIEYKGIDTITGNKIFTIRENNDDYLYLSYNILGSTYVPRLSATPTNWVISVAPGGGCCIKVNDYSSKFLGILGGSLVLSSDLTDSQKCWRIVGRSSYDSKELGTVTANNLIVEVGGTVLPSLILNPSAAYWISSLDFDYLPLQGSEHISIDNSTKSFSGVTPGTATIKVVHKVTGEFAFFTITVKTTYLYELHNTFAFSYENAELIYSVYQRVEQIYPLDSTIVKAWKSSRILGGLIYDKGAAYGIPWGILVWNDVAGKVFDGTEQAFFVDTLGYSQDEYEQLLEVIQGNHNNLNTIDFAHFQISLAARLAYNLQITGMLSNLYTLYSDEDVSYLAGWFGDATIIDGSGTTVFGNDDYCADLDAESIYRLIDQGLSLISASSLYYQSLSNNTTRATIFLSHLPFSVVKSKIYYDLIDRGLAEQVANHQLTPARFLELINDETYHLTMLLTYYPDTYYFLLALQDEAMCLG